MKLLITCCPMILRIEQYTEELKDFIVDIPKFTQNMDENHLINIIKDYEVVEKSVVEVPDKVTGIVKCVNPKCITNFEEVTTKFKVVSKDIVSLKCSYCEKITDQENFEII